MSMTPIDMPTVVDRLRRRWPEAIIDGDVQQGGCWIRAVSNDGSWEWVRYCLTSPGAAQTFAEVALEEFHGA